MSLKLKTKHWLRRALRTLGMDVMAYSVMRSHELRRIALLRDCGIGLVVDGGAHKGEYASSLRQLDYRGRILSVEPLPGPFAELRDRAERDSSWECVNLALGESPGQTQFLANAISQVSSLLPATGLVNTEGWRGTTSLTVELRTIDELLEERSWEGGLYIKLDVQGYEMQALRGGAQALRKAAAIELELSTVELYRGSVLFSEAVWQLHQLGYSLFSSEPALVDYQSARMLQVDCIFVRNASTGPTA